MGRHHGNHQVELTAAEAKVVVNSVVKTSGTVEANSITQHNGMVKLGSAFGSSTTFSGNANSKVKLAGGQTNKGTAIPDWRPEHGSTTHLKERHHGRLVTAGSSTGFRQCDDFGLRNDRNDRSDIKQRNHQLGRVQHPCRRPCGH